MNIYIIYSIQLKFKKGYNSSKRDDKNMSRKITIMTTIYIAQKSTQCTDYSKYGIHIRPLKLIITFSKGGQHV